MLVQAQTIEEVVSMLTQIIDDCRRRNSRLGFFPAMYRKVTQRIDDGIRQGRFENGQRMERLDVVFANRYLGAYRRYVAGLRPTRSWTFAFEMAQRPQPMIVQHLLLGINAHINLDLGIAAAEVCRGRNLDSLKNDFFAVNDVLATLLDEVQRGVNESSPLFQILDRLGWRVDEAMGSFSIHRARQSAWNKAVELHQLPEYALAARIEAYDREAESLARIVCPPFALGSDLFEAISRTETQQPREIIEQLC